MRAWPFMGRDPQTRMPTERVGLDLWPTIPELANDSSRPQVGPNLRIESKPIPAGNDQRNPAAIPSKKTTQAANRGPLKMAGVVAALALAMAGCSTASDGGVAAESVPATPTSETTVTPSLEPDPQPPKRQESPSSTRTVPLTAVDGDTVKLLDGQSVRVIGIDTPERGECGYHEATDLTQQTISQGATLQRVAGHENTDRYDRLLRYVVTDNGVDLGTRLLRAGLATARYDSRDGYDSHPKEDKYHTIDSRTAHKCGTSGTTNTPPGVSGSSSGSGKCDPNYGGSCVPLSGTDLDCSDISGAVTVNGADIHRFDGDGDGRGCA
jgi:endonuclease YncB( thermonuclease family)